MSALLDSLCGQQRLAECAVNDKALCTADRALLSADAKMTANRFWVQIGQKHQAPRLTFGYFAEDAMTAASDSEELARPGERIEVLPAGDLQLVEPDAWRAAWAI